MTPSIYLDNSASTKLAPEVIEAIVENLHTHYGNPSSLHQFGKKGKRLIKEAKACIADLFEVDPSEVIFTSGGTESMNLIIIGSALAKLATSKTLDFIYSPLDHPCTLKSLEWLAKHYQVNLIPVKTGPFGAPTPQDFEEALSKANLPHTLAVFSAVNSETGCMMDMQSLAHLAFNHKVPLLVDGVALLGKTESHTLPEGVAAIGFSSHKIHGPSGIGFVIKRKNHPCSPLMLGGGQMEGMRAGSENLIGLAGLKAAINLIKGQEKALCQKLHDNTLFLKKELKAANIAFEENGEAPKAPGLCNLYFPHIDAETLLIYLDQNGIAVSAGTACASGGVEPSYVLKGMGYSQERILHSIRISLSRFTAPEELSQLITTISKTI